MLAEQDQALPDLARLGCDKSLTRIRRMTLHEIAALLHKLEEQAGLGATLGLQEVAEGDHSLKIVCAQVMKSWDSCCSHLSHLLLDSQLVEHSYDEKAYLESAADAEAMSAASALLRVLRWLRPLVLGFPSTPLWLRPISREHCRPDLVIAATTWIQRRWRARQDCSRHGPMQ